MNGWHEFKKKSIFTLTITISISLKHDLKIQSFKIMLNISQ